MDPFVPPFPRRLLHVLHIWILQEEFREGAFGAVVLYSSPLRFSVVGRKLLKNHLTRADRCALVFRDHVLEEFFLLAPTPRASLCTKPQWRLDRVRKHLRSFRFYVRRLKMFCVCFRGTGATVVLRHGCLKRLLRETPLPRDHSGCCAAAANGETPQVFVHAVQVPLWFCGNHVCAGTLLPPNHNGTCTA